MVIQIQVLFSGACLLAARYYLKKKIQEKKRKKSRKAGCAFLKSFPFVSSRYLRTLSGRTTLWFESSWPTQVMYALNTISWQDPLWAQLPRVSFFPFLPFLLPTAAPRPSSPQFSGVQGRGRASLVRLAVTALVFPLPLWLQALVLRIPNCQCLGGLWGIFILKKCILSSVFHCFQQGDSKVS